MTRTIKAELHYGFSLGDSEYGDGWEFAEVDEDDEPTLSWWDGGEDGDSFNEQAMAVLLTAAGFTETDWRADGYFKRKSEIEARLGVEFKHAGFEFSRTLLIAAGTTRKAYTSEATIIDSVAMIRADTKAMDEALANALTVLGITPKQEKPAWLLTCYYG